MSCRVVHLTSVHHPFDTRIFHKECKSLAMGGYDVTLIAPRAEGDTVEQGIKLRAIPMPRNRRQRMTRTVWQVYEAAVGENAEIYHFHDPELMPVGALLKMRGKRVIYDVHEDYARALHGKQWLPGALRAHGAAAVSVCESMFSAVYDRVIAVTPPIAEKFSPKRTRVVQNFPWRHELCFPDGVPYEQREAIVVYVGWLSDIRGLREMQQAVTLAAREVPVRLVVAGEVRQGAPVEFEGERGNGLVERVGHLNRPQVAELLARARVGLVLFHPLPNHVNAQPNKLFEYMSAGLPVVASDFPRWREIVDSAGCGLTADPLNPSSIAAALLWLLRHPSEAAEMGRNGQRAIAERYNWERESERLLATYAELQ